MNIATGTDLIEVARVRDAVHRHGDRFLQRVFTFNELIACNGNIQSLAARFAAKEATSKALGCGIGDVGWRDIEVVSDSKNSPRLKLHNQAAKIADEQELMWWSISLSHTRAYAIAFVVAMSKIV